MQVEYARCCGLDGHQKSVVACVLVTAEDGSVQRQVRTFATMTADLLAPERLVERAAGGAGGDGEHRRVHAPHNVVKRGEPLQKGGKGRWD
jgi:hypothetical protein